MEYTITKITADAWTNRARVSKSKQLAERGCVEGCSCVVCGSGNVAIVFRSVEVVVD